MSTVLYLEAGSVEWLMTPSTWLSAGLSGFAPRLSFIATKATTMVPTSTPMTMPTTSSSSLSEPDEDDPKSLEPDVGFEVGAVEVGTGIASGVGSDVVGVDDGGLPLPSPP